MIGGLYESSLAGLTPVDIEYADGRRTPLPVQDWLSERPGDAALLDRCAGLTLDIGSGPGRLTVALGERGVPALGIDVTLYTVELCRAAGGLALHRDVFDRVPGAGRWETVLLADGNIGIGGDPEALLLRVAELMRPGGQALIEVTGPGTVTRTECVRLRSAAGPEDWFRWAQVAIDDAATLAPRCGLTVADRWTEAGRWFVTLTR
ncbi:class I SAM-dependent methyltransferase [Actinomadura scrupuli]|uniref:class I SAM-dependent methyltransferase n=1 Tax=Actinomadura scrupuli TaxID=559629 RepID=UPI003D979603